jgi:hypothetical protein
MAKGVKEDVNQIMSWNLNTLSQVWESVKEVNPKHSKWKSLWDLEDWNVPNIWDKNANKKSCSNESFIYPWKALEV